MTNNTNNENYVACEIQITRPKRTLSARLLGGAAGVYTFGHGVSFLQDSFDSVSSEGRELSCLISNDPDFFLFCSKGDPYDSAVLTLPIIAGFLVGRFVGGASANLMGYRESITTAHYYPISKDRKNKPLDLVRAFKDRFLKNKTTVPYQQKDNIVDLRPK